MTVKARGHRKVDVIEFLKTLEPFADGEMDLEDLQNANQSFLDEHPLNPTLIPHPDLVEYLEGIRQMLDNEEVEFACEEFLKERI